LLFVAGCGGGGARGPLPSGNNDVSSQAAHISPNVVQTGIDWTQFGYAVAVGSDKNVWFANSEGGLMQVQMSGKEKLVPLTYVYDGTSSTNFYSGYGITVGKDKNFYMTGQNYDYNNDNYVIGVATTTGKLTVHDIKSDDYGGQGSLALGPDGNVWFTEQKHIAKITTAGVITEYTYPSGATSNSYGGVAAGPDGNVWFTEYNNGIVGKIVPSTGVITEYTLSTQGISCNPEAIVAAADGYLYFACNGYNVLGQISTSGVATKFYDAYGITYLAEGVIEGPDGNPWFADANGAFIGEFNSSNDSFTNYVPPYSSGTVYSLALGPDGNIWSAENDNKIDVYIVKKITLNPTSFAFTAAGQSASLTVSEPGTTAWTATSVSPGVCAIAQGNEKSIFTVTAKGAGKTTITVKDAIGNSITAPCSVK
jgi:streptogramin lyase